MVFAFCFAAREASTYLVFAFGPLVGVAAVYRVGVLLGLLLRRPRGDFSEYLLGLLLGRRLEQVVLPNGASALDSATSSRGDEKGSTVSRAADAR